MQLVDSAKGKIPRTLPRLAWLPPASLAALLAFFYVLPAEIVLGGMNWIPLVNMVLSALGALLVAALAAVSYLGGNGPAVLPLGAGMLAYGVSNLLANLILLGGRLDSGLAVANLGYNLAGFSSLFAAASLMRFPQKRFSVRPLPRLIASYAAGLLLTGGLVWASFSGLLPVFFVPGVGSTAVRYLVLGAAVAEFALTAGLLWITARRNHSAFLSWYSLGIALLAIGMAGAFGYKHIDSLAAWVIRLAIYSGNFYLIVAMVIAVRQSGRWVIPLSDLKETHIRYMSLVDTMPDAILVHAGGHYVFANPAAAVLFGAKDPRALLGMALLDLVHPDSHQLVKNGIGYHTPIGKSSGTTELTVMRLDGTPVQVERIASAVEYGGKPAVQVVLRDITERKRLEAERERLLSDQRMRMAEQDAIFASMLVGMFVYDRNGHIVHVNQAAQEMFGYTDADMSLHFTQRMAALHMETSEGKPLLPEEAPASRALKGELVRNLPLRAHLRNGEICWMLANASPVLDERGEAFGAVLTVIDISTRKKAEEALQESEARLRSVLNTTQDVIVRIGLQNGRYEYVSPSVEALVGYSPEEFMDMDWQTALAMVHSDDRYVLQDATALAEDTGQAAAEYRQRTKNGNYIWVSNRMTVVKDSSGRPQFRTSSIRDISRRKQLEEDRARLLVEAEKRTAELEATISSLATGLIVYDTTGKAVMMNKVAEEILPREPFTMTVEERHKTVPSEREDGEVFPTEEMPVSRSLRGETVRNVVMSVRGRDHKLWTSVCTAPICAPDGKVIGVVASFVDITERIQMEENLRHQAELLEHAPVLVRNLKDEIILWNRGMENLYGYSREEALGKVTHTLLRTIHSQPLPEILSTIMEKGQWVGELHHFRRDGSIVVVTSLQTLHVEGNGTPSAIIEVNNDITERKQLEEALQRLNVTLEEQVVERTAIAEGRAKQLQALTLQLSEAEERERRRIAELLHDDVQQLLSAARFNLSALPRAVQANETASSVVARVDKLLEESIEKSRRLSQDLSPPVLFHAGLAQAVEWLARQMQERYGLKVKVEAPDPILVQDDLLKVFIFRWIQEILFNVVKHAGVDRAVVRLERRGERLELEVSDEGRGFDPQSLFGTGSSGGLGLFSIRERISDLGGQLEIKSAPDLGTRLRLSISMLDRPKKLTAPPYPAQRPPARTRSSGAEQQTRYRILLADDHKVLRQGLLAVLEAQSGFQVVGEAANGRQAVELARSLEPDLVVMDIMMPEMDGIEATRQIKAEFPQMRVIGLSMMADEEITGRLLEAGAEAFINKGNASEMLIEAIRGKPGV